MPLRIYTSNRMENLVEALAIVLSEPLASPFTPEMVVVQSKGMQRWLAMELARKFGVWANCKYPFPNKLVWQLFCKALPNIPDVSIFSPEIMTWKIMGLLPEYLEREEFTALRHYLLGDADGLKRFQLSGKIADTFDQYTLFRPEMLLEWEEGRAGEWQEILWRDIAASGKGQHRGRLKDEYCRQVDKAAPGGNGGLERIAVFGISYLPKYHMDILAATARHMDVNLFLLSPTHEYWADIVSKREMVRLAPEALALRVEGNPLLAPYISTVFEGCQDPIKKTPYSIADRNITKEGEIAAVVLKLLGLPGSRLTVPQVFDILEKTPVRRCFDLDENELETIRGWLEETRVRWGMDERDRARLGLPDYRDNSWHASLDRLLLGYAMPDEGGSLFNGKLPYDEMEGANTQTLGKFVGFIDKIAAIATKLARARTLGEWREELRSMLGDFIAVDDDSARELAAVAGVVENIGELEDAAGFTEKLELGVIRSWLSTRLAQEEKGLGFMTGGVTFCAMLPMRSIPFRVVALIGMNDGAFPRQGRPPGFDLIFRNPRRGDRSLRDEDRYLFLEAILSARDCLYISYIGQSIKDNSEIPPSVLVSEFLDAIERGFPAAEDLSKESRLVVKHRLQAFSCDYFNGKSALSSFSAENCAAQLEKRTNPWQPAEFISTPIAPPSEEWRDVSLAKLLRFFDNPARYLLENRLGIRLEDVAVPLEEREPFAFAGLEAYGLKQELLEICLLGGDVESFLPVARCRGILPPARHGEELFAAAAEEVTEFAATVQEKLAGNPPLIPLDFELNLGDFRLTGRLDRIWQDHLVRYRCAKMKAKDRMRTWLEHLVLNAVNQEGYPCESLLLMTDSSIKYGPVENAAVILQTILDLYWDGLTVPLRFFPASSMEYAKKQEWRLERARARWEEGYNYPGEGDDPYFKLCFGQVDPFNADFERVSRALLEPLLQHQV